MTTGHELPEPGALFGNKLLEEMHTERSVEITSEHPSELCELIHIHITRSKNSQCQ